MTSIRERLASAALHSVMVIAIEALLTGTLIAATVKFVAAAAKWNHEASLYAAIVLGVLAALSVLLTLLIMRRNRVFIPHRQFTYSFDLRRFSINYLNMDKPVHKRRYIVRANVEGLDRVTDAFSWTGDDADLPACTFGDCEIRACGKSGLFTIFEIVFPSRLGKGKTKEIELTWTLDNTGRRAAPFLSMTVTQPTTRVEFEANLPSGSFREPAYLTTCPHVHVLLSDDTTELAFNDGHVLGALSEPRLFSHNELRWRWS